MGEARTHTTSESIRAYAEGLSPRQKEGITGFLLGLDQWTRSTSPDELLRLLLGKLVTEEGPEGAAEVLGIEKMAFSTRAVPDVAQMV